jgi:ankyrin repeat protein
MALVRGGASIHAKDRYGNTPREIALQYGRAEVAAFLTSVGAPDALGNVGMQTDAGGQRHKQVLSASLASVSSRPVEIAEDKL